ncbi:lipid IV(A) 3-deoxy-D-manno-octulosonic acid transferase [Natronospira bacteriovora]|uniref:3-deoxy-D-manno-octulosonic acid transferase n=1 Tax=Natronospira bacteriovora TaxID=3069753 RepID=A0ABU0W6G1_9GAMM|nr:lipid IV(A) 3-deoxy-D-manno-octulosonic acid transferase [Natronospira sp. AB-CW4]MDQ2069612.1 lipid IV(A) 3-deoxy-D-manno-octulosonic acid transferase [Natronospira sp. AB-CW4]
MSRTLYNLALAALMPVALPLMEWRARRQTRAGDAWAQRLGFIDQQPAGEGPIWVHAASVGEVQAALPLLRALDNAMPHRRIVVTTFTAAGARRLAEAAGDRVVRLMLPYDLPRPVNRFLDRLRPAALLVTETELWPNLFRAVRARGIPLMIGSARLSEKAHRRYRRIPGLVHEALSCVDMVAAQSDADAERFRDLGAPVERVETFGNVKFDLHASSSVAEQGAGLRRSLFGERPVWVAGSTRQGEEEKLLDALEQIRIQKPDILLVLAPRHPERAGHLKQLIKARGLSSVSRSDGASAEGADVFIVDTLGELMTFYATADVAFVGGSLVPVGGHNLLEPVVLGIPVLTGPYYDNARDVAEMLIAAGAVKQVNDSTALAERVLTLINDGSARAEQAAAGWAVIERNRGAVNRLVERLARLMGEELLGGGEF